MKKNLFALAALLVAASSCTESMDSLTKRVLATATSQVTLMDARLELGMSPRSINENGDPIDQNITWWCSGFFPGTCWYIYQMTGDEAVKSIAEKQTRILDSLIVLPTHHDIGFQINSSFGNAYRFTGDASYLPTVEAAAAKLAKRFNPVTGVTMSWEPSARWQYPVIIDNMMNLELLEYASGLFHCDSLNQIALTHARTTMKNHFRPDFTTYHVVDYNPADGSVNMRCTHQGYADESAWGRGQAWALYGYTMMASYTGEADMLDQAENVAAMLLGRLPEDGIPYWDFDAPDVPDALRDASAGAVMASAFVTLSTLTGDVAKAKEYKAMAERQIRTLASPEYMAAPGENGDFILKHSVGSLPANSEVDVPLTYADYYFIEAICKYNQL